MDHLPRVTVKARPEVVPYFGGTWDDQEWHSYPARHGWNIEALHRGSGLDGRSLEEFHAFLQTWLFFGVLCVLLDEPFASVLPRYLASKEYGQTIVSTSLLKDLSIIKQRVEEKEVENQEWLEWHESIAWETQRHLREIIGNHSIPYGLELSLIIFTESAFPQSSPTFGAPKYLEEKLIEFGCCPCLYSTLLPIIGASGAYMKYLMGPSRSEYSHGSCTMTECVALQTNKSTYIASHIACCPTRPNLITEDHLELGIPECYNVAIDHGALFEVLKTGTFPVVSMHRVGERWQAQVEPFKEGLKYVAISHAMADGMGNFSKNAIPVCRVIDLLSLLSSMLKQDEFDADGYQLDTPCFWLDTLCVPVEGLKGRHEALLLMKTTFQKADTVLVLDAGLRMESLTTDIELVIRIMSCGWSNRLWTLWEMIFSNNIYFAFLNTFINLRSLLSRIVEENPISTASVDCIVVYGLVGRFLSNLGWRKLHSEGSVENQYVALMISLEGRNTSDANDEPICLASVLDLKQDAILKAIGPAGKMKSFWTSQSHVPWQVILMNVPRLPENGFRWAPLSLLAFHKHVNYPADCRLRGPNAEITPQGLRFKTSGYVFDSCKRNVSWKIAFRTEDGREFKLCPIGYPSYSEFSQVPLESATSLAILHNQRPIGELGSAAIHQVALVNITSESKSQILAEYLGVLLLFTDQTSNMLSPNEDSTCTRGRRVDTEWCIS